eukprot:TRINITY_DN10691_c0_g1_i1.p1 TRINITY_DN10691_c0_g1~~TRINITY_DN10691_c0_g1_i1.p1  ORF type:complete len:979 (+),score=204.62 TRINITY_DN10691_c0_g1_i1:33-2939(+)
MHPFIEHPRDDEGQEEEEEEHTYADLPHKFVLHYFRAKDEEFRVYLDMAVFLPFLVIFTISLLSEKGVGGKGYYMAAGIRQSLTDGLWDQGTSTDLFFGKSLGDIQQGGDFWSWATASDILMAFFPNESMFVTNGQARIVGPVRFRQWRTKPENCTALEKYTRHTPTGPWMPCYKPYSNSDADLRDINSNTTQCGMDFPLGKLGYNGWRVYDHSKSSPVKGYPGLTGFPQPVTKGWRSTYDYRKAFMFDVWPNYLSEKPDLGSDQEPLDAKAKFDCMQNSRWIDDSTRAIGVTFFLYNPQEDMVATAQVLVEIGNEGHISTLSRYPVFRPPGFTGGWLRVREGIIMLYILFFLVKLFYDLFTSNHRLLFLVMPWTLLEITNLVILIVGYYWRIKFWILPTLEFQVSSSTHSSIMSYPPTHRQYYLELATAQRMEVLADWYASLNRLLSLNGLLMYVKVFKYLSVSPHLNLLTETIRESQNALITLVFYLFVIMIAFTMMAMLLYGNLIDKYRTTARSIGTLFRLALGELDYDGLQEADRQYTPVFFYLYILIVWLLILNMIVGIVSEGFDSAKSRQENAIVTMGSFFFQKSMVQRVLANSAKLASFLRLTLPGEKEQKRRSPVHWNRIEGVGLPSVVAVLEKLDGVARQNNDLINIDDFMDGWRNCQKTMHLGEDKGRLVAAAVWKLMESTRESIHTHVAIFEDKLESSRRTLKPAPFAKERENKDDDIGGVEKVSVDIVSATDIPKLDVVGSSDPFVAVIYGKCEKTTAVIHNNLNPIWNETIDIHATEEARLQSLKLKDLVLKVWDFDQLKKNDLVGVVRVDLTALTPNTTVEFDSEIMNGKRSCGQLKYRVTLTRVERPGESGPTQTPRLAQSLKSGDLVNIREILRHLQAQMKRDVQRELTKMRENVTEDIRELLREAPAAYAVEDTEKELDPPPTPDLEFLEEHMDLRTLSGNPSLYGGDMYY